MKTLLLVAFFTSLFSIQLSAQWLNANPGAGGQVQHVVCDPNHTGKMYLCSDMEGFYVSTDFGDHWTYKGWEAPYSFIFNIAVEPENSERLYLTSSQGLAITDDAGDSWKVENQFNGMSIATISIDQNNKDWICLAESWLETVIGNKKGMGILHYSLDRGESWKSSTFTNYTTNKNVYSINFHPSEERNDILVSISDGIFVSNDELISWEKIAPPENTTSCQGCDFTPDGKWLYAVYIRHDGNTGVYVKKYDDDNWQELDADGFLQGLNQTHWRPKVWSGSNERNHYVLFGPLKAAGNYNDNGLNEGKFLVENDKVYGHINQVLKVEGTSEPFDVGWNAYWSHCRTYQYYPKNWEVEGVSRGVFAMCQQSTFRGDATKPHEWVVNTSHHSNTQNLTKFYRTNGTASTWVWDIAGVDNYVVMGMGDNGVSESWDNGFSWTQKFAPTMWNVDATEVVKGDKKLVLAGRTNGFGGALYENKGWLYYRELNLNYPSSGWKTAIDGFNSPNLKGLDPVLNRIATIQSDPHKPERVYLGTNYGLYVTENIFELIKNNPEYNFKSISQPVIGTTLTRRVHVDPNNPDILFLRSWKGTFRIEKQTDGSYQFIKLKVNGSDSYLADGWGHNGDITVWANDTITCLMVTRNLPDNWETWLSFDKGNTFTKVLDKNTAFAIRPPENAWFKNQSPVIYGGLCGFDSTFFTSVHIRGGGDGLTKGISFIKGTIQADSSIILEDFTGDPKNGGNWFPAARSGKIWKDGSGNPAIHLASMGAGMWKRSLVGSYEAKASFQTNTTRGNLPLEISFDASASLPSDLASNIISYEWDFGDGKTGSGINITHKYMLKKTFTARLTITDDLGNKGYAYKKIEGYIYGPVADFVASTYNGETLQLIQFFGELSFDQSPKDSITSYLWDFGDGHGGSGKNIFHPFEKSGTFNVKLTVRNQNFKSSSITKKISITPYSGIHQNNSDYFEVFPNPVNDKLFVRLTGLAELVVYNSSGQKILAQNTIENSCEINTQDWTSGIYIFSIQQNDKMKRMKIIKY